MRNGAFNEELAADDDGGQGTGKLNRSRLRHDDETDILFPILILLPNLYKDPQQQQQYQVFSNNNYFSQDLL